MTSKSKDTMTLREKYSVISTTSCFITRTESFVDQNLFPVTGNSNNSCFFEKGKKIR
jgi:hypothetical protein